MVQTLKRKQTFNPKRQLVKKVTRQITASGANPRAPIWRTGSLCDKKIFPIVSSDNLNITFVPSSGLGGVSGDITFAVCQQGILYQQGNGAWTSGTAFNNYASLAAVFQQYRILRFEIDIYYSQNSAPNGTPATTCFPILYGVLDREDDRNLGSAQVALQYSSCKIMQMGNSSGSSGGKQTMTMVRPSVFRAVNNNASLTGTVVESELAYSPWLSCGTNTAGSVAAVIPHGYIKFWCDAVNNTASTAIGAFTFVPRVLFEFRGID